MVPDAPSLPPGVGLLRAGLLAAGLLGACSEDAVVRDSRLVVDVATCLEVARSADCGDVLRADGGGDGGGAGGGDGGGVGGGARACLLLGADGAQAVYGYAYDPGAGSFLADAAEGLLTLDQGRFLTLELWVLRAGQDRCPAPRPGQACDDEPSCLLSFGEEQVRIDGDEVRVAYGGEGGSACRVECADACDNAETCDGADEDCDGRTDEDLTPPPEAACLAVGVCEGAGPVCEGAAGWRCPYPPTHEPDGERTCDGLDNDCDGLVDEPEHLAEGGEVGQPCGEAAGACEAGRTVCRGGAILCEGGEGPSAEACDGLDNDCDGLTDEDFALDAGGGAALPIDADCAAEGQCGAGVVVCSRDGASACCSTSAGCRGLGGDEVCDGLDNDCDGATDEDVAPLDADACLDGGVCAGTVATCDGARGWTCAYPAAYEADRERTCDGLDNDCDGAVDDRDDLFLLGVIGGRCGSNVGACRFGATVCVGGEVLCESGVDPRPETCDGTDEDCDGEADDVDDLTAAGIVGAACGDSAEGQCRRGVQACLRGSVACDGLVLPSAEACDGLDNDCDGGTDEDWRGIGDASLGTECGDAGPAGCGGTTICGAQGDRTCCSTDEACNPAFDPDAEICDGRDNDCDGETDEGFGVGLFCQGRGVCPPGRRECAGPGTTRCDTLPGGSAYAGGPETCDGQDDDCDGLTDDGFEVGGVAVGAACAGIGACPDGVVECVHAGAAACSTNPGGRAYVRRDDVCDRVDNDCDGVTDEGFAWQGVAVGGVCQGVGECGVGVVECRDAATTACSTNPDGTRRDDEAEDCDGLDNDCDGAADEPRELVAEPCALQDGVCAGATKACGGLAGWLPCDAARHASHNARYEADEAACDGADNDCDGRTDEPFPAKGAECTLGQGVCRAAGRQVCNVAGNGIVCDADPGDPAAEVCDGLDNDCDGGTDEPQNLVPEPCANQAGVCSGAVKACGGVAGWRQCNAERFIAHSADYEAVEATCDGLDNDCDGQDDEPFATLGDPCAAGVGACMATGQWVCDDGGGRVECSAAPGNPARGEACNDIDDDCDGGTDEDQPIGQACGIALCPAGTQGTFQCDDQDGDGGVDGRCEPAVFIRTAADVACYTFTRGHAATYVADANGTVAHAASDVPRFAYAASTGRTHLLVEGERANLLVDTSAPDEPAWQPEANGPPYPTFAAHEAGAPDALGGPYTEVLTGLRHASGIRQVAAAPLLAGVSYAHSLWTRSGTGGRVALSLPRHYWVPAPTWGRVTDMVGVDDDLTLDFIVMRHYHGQQHVERFDVWGMQAERGKFTSTYIPRETAADPGVRPADLLAVPAAALDPARGTWLSWFSPLYTAANADEPPTLLDSGGAVTVSLDLDGPAEWRCATSTAEVVRAASVSAGAWVFVACAWDAASGLSLWVGPGADLGPVADPGAFPPAAAPARPVAPLPEWSLLGEARLYRRALADDEIDAVYAATRASYP